MDTSSGNKEQQHPLYNRDRQIVNTLLTGQPTDYNLAELARLRIRYNGFPGAKDIQTDLDKVMQMWGLTEAGLYEKTRQIHASMPVYKGRGNKGEEEDWN
jgi:hypothetical protein